jgi:TonB family protein
MGAQAMIFVNFVRFDPSKITVTVGLLDVGHHDEVPRLKISAPFVLDASQEKAATQHLYPFATLLGEIDRSQKWSDRAKDGQYSVEAKCGSCPNPNFSERARHLKIQGEVWLNVTITPNGEVTDISLVRTAGSGLDEESVMTLRRWRFNPARDKDGNPVSERIPLEITFQLY